ncbi:MAG: hypothetical protein SOW59_08980 [Corynebacterium sp.]|nr:hypothetical protein [Corynebacterium sp.]
MKRSLSILGGGKSNQQIIIEALGEARLAPYLEAANGNRKEALRLYRWSVKLTAAVQETLGITEVLIRNAIDQQLQEWNNAQKPTSTSWLLTEPASPLLGLINPKRREACRRAQKSVEHRSPNHPRYGQAPTHDDVLANTMFGMWKDILPNHAPSANPENDENKNRKFMWGQAVSKAFPNEYDPDGEKTYWRVSHLHLLRNRVSHMDSLLNVDVLDATHDAFALVNSIDSKLCDWLTGTSTIRAIYGEKSKKK